MGKVTIYGLECSLPEKPKDKDIPGYGKTFRKQKFEQATIPESFSELSFDDNDNPIYSEDQEKFILEQITRCNDGYWFFNKGVATYMTGLYYYYVNFWKLENGKFPEYRETDRLFFIFFEECWNDPKILGVIRGKKRREGATSQGTCASVKIATFDMNQRCGNISKTGTDVEDLFQNMIVYGYFSLPVFLQARVDTSTNPKTKLNFVEPAKRGASATKGRTITQRQGLNSFIDYRNTALNSYDSGRFSFILVDEGGKWEKVDIKKYWPIVKQVLLVGGSKVGMAYLPSTVNEPLKGGDSFKYLWENSNQFAEGRHGTSTEMVKFFQPAWEGLGGFIDEWGFSVIDPPDPKTLAYLVEKIKELPPKERIPEEDLAKGAKKYLEDKLEKIKDAESRNEQQRMYPFKELDMFDYGETTSPFNLENITAQEEWLKANPQFIRRGKLIWGDGDIVEFKDDSNGNWEILKLPKQSNRFIKSTNGQIQPQNNHNYVGGVDPFRLNTVGLYSSKGVIYIFENMDASNPDETCMPIAKYRGRPKEKDLFFEECMKGFLFYGCKGTFEMDATDDYIGYFKTRNALQLLNYTPDEAVNRGKRGKKIERGVRSADPFALEKQLKVAVSYIEHHCHKIMFPSLLEDLRKYDHSNRTERDESVAFMMCLLSALGTTRGEQQQTRKNPLVETFTVNIFNR